jgi:hypothetical protein
MDQIRMLVGGEWPSSALLLARLTPDQGPGPRAIVAPEPIWGDMATRSWLSGFVDNSSAPGLTGLDADPAPSGSPATPGGTRVAASPVSRMHPYLSILIIGRLTDQALWDPGR